MVSAGSAMNVYEKHERQKRTWLVKQQQRQQRKHQQQPRCRRRERTEHGHPQCTAVVTPACAPNPPLRVCFDDRLLPPLYHYTDYSRVLTSTVLASLPPQNWVIEQRQRQPPPPPPPPQQQQQFDQRQRWIDQEQQRQKHNLTSDSDGST